MEQEIEKKYKYRMYIENWGVYSDVYISKKPTYNVETNLWDVFRVTLEEPKSEIISPTKIFAGWMLKNFTNDPESKDSDYSKVVVAVDMVESKPNNVIESWKLTDAFIGEFGFDVDGTNFVLGFRFNICQFQQGKSFHGEE